MRSVIHVYCFYFSPINTTVTFLSPISSSVKSGEEVKEGELRTKYVVHNHTAQKPTIKRNTPKAQQSLQ